MTLVIVAVGACKRQSAPIERNTPMKTDREEPAAIGREIGVPLPATARVLGVRRTRGMDDAIFAKIEISEAEWSHLRTVPPLGGVELVPESRAYLEPDDGWWDPTTRPSLRAAQIALPGARFLNVGIDHGAHSVVLYLMNHGT